MKIGHVKIVRMDWRACLLTVEKVPECTSGTQQPTLHAESGGCCDASCLILDALSLIRSNVLSPTCAPTEDPYCTAKTKERIQGLYEHTFGEADRRYGDETIVHLMFVLQGRCMTGRWEMGPGLHSRRGPCLHRPAGPSARTTLRVAADPCASKDQHDHIHTPVCCCQQTDQGPAYLDKNTTTLNEHI